MGDFDHDTHHDFGEKAPDDRPIFLVDMDGVLADLEGYMYGEFATRHPELELVHPDDRKSFYLDEDHPEEFSPLLRSILTAEHAFARPQPIPGAVGGIKRLLSIGEVFICTSPLISNPTCINDKIKWVESWLGVEWVKRMVICKDKTTVRGTWLIDDRPTVDGRLVPTWEHIVFHWPYNQHVEGRRAASWIDVVHMAVEEFG